MFPRCKSPLFFFQQCHLLTESNSFYIVPDLWWVCFLELSLVLRLVLFPKVNWTVSAMGLIWCALCSSLWAGDFCFINPRPKLKLIFQDTYHVAFPNDSMQRKALVYGVYTAELIQTVLFTKTSFEQFVIGFGNAQILDEAGLRELWFAVPILSSAGVYHLYIFVRLLTGKLVAFVVQVFYAYRIKLLAESNVCAIIITVVKFLFMPLEWLVLICVVCLGPIRRGNYNRYICQKDSLFRPGYGPEDTYINWCMYFNSRPTPFTILRTPKS